MTDESRKPGGAKTVLGWQTQPGWADQLQQQPQPYVQPQNNAQVYAQHAQTHAAAHQQQGYAPTVQISPGYAQQYAPTPSAGTPYASTGYGQPSSPSSGYGASPAGPASYGTPSNASPSTAYGNASPSTAFGTNPNTPSYASPNTNYGNASPSTGNPTPSYASPNTNYGNASPSTGYASPNTGYGTPSVGDGSNPGAPSYGMPSYASTGYGTPSVGDGSNPGAPSYGTPSTPSTYGNASPGYGTSSVGNGNPGAPSYGTPSYATGYGTGNQPSYGTGNTPGFPSYGASSYPSAAAYNQVPQRGSTPDVGDPARPIAGADATVGVSQRVRFIRLTYLHLLFAILAFAGFEWALMTVPVLRETVSDPFTKFALAGRWNWGVVLGAFVATSYAADYFAQHSESRGLQYMGLLLYVIAEAVIFVPLLAIVEWKTHDILARGGENPNIIRDSAYVTLALFGGLTASVFISKKDFSFLRSGLCMASAGALSLIALSLVFGFNLGLVFSIGMVFLAAGYILFQTSQILEHHDPRQHVSAALELFSSVALMFWYVIRIFLRARE